MIYIGTSGWTYKDWKNIFYPFDLPNKKWLEFFNSSDTINPPTNQAGSASILYDVITSDFIYIRMHGPTGSYNSKYTINELKGWAQKINK